MTTCTGPECTRETSRRDGLCEPHSQQMRRSGTLKPLHVKDPQGQCIGPDCDRKALSHQMCGGHREQWRQGKELQPLRHPVRGQCEGPGPEGTRCERKAAGKGLCGPHWAQRKRGSTLHPIGEVKAAAARPAPKRKPTGPRRCLVIDCNAPHYGLDLCRQHYDQQQWQKRRGDTPTPVADMIAAAHKPASIFPPGWDRVTPKREIPKPNGSEIRMDGPVVIPPGLLASARRVLEQHDALDLADMLGLAAA